MPNMTFQDSAGKQITINSPDGSTPSETELDQLFAASSQQSQKSSANTDSAEINNNLSSIPNTPGLPDRSTPESSEVLNIGDHAALSFLNNTQDQKDYLQKKFPFVVPTQNGTFMVGQSADNLTPLDPKSSGNNFFGWLASQTSQIPSMVGMGIGATLGTVEPGGGNVLGAAAGAAAGEAISKGIGHALGSTDSLTKDAVDSAISGAFGAVGQKASQMLGLSASKFIAPKLAQAVDAKLTSIVQSGGNPSKFINFVSSAVHFASGADAEDVKTLMQYGVNKTLDDPTINNKNAIINISKDIIDAVQSKKSELGAAVGQSNRNLLEKAGNIKGVNTSPIYDYVVQEINSHPGWGSVEGNIITLNRNMANSADSSKLAGLLRSLGAEDVRNVYQAPKSSQLLRQAEDTAKTLQLKINNPSDHPIIEKALGLNKGDIANELEKVASGKQEFLSTGARAFKIPEKTNISVNQAVGTQDVFGQLTHPDSKTLSDDMKRVFTNILYRDVNGNDSPLMSQLSKVASANKVDDYIANKLAYKNFMKSVEGVRNSGFDPFDAKSIQDYGKHINDRQPVDAQTLSNLENNVGKPILDNLRRYSAVQKLSNFNPNFLRLGLISGMVGGMLGDGDFEKRVSRGAFIGVGLPLGLKMSLRGVENAGVAGKGILNSLIKTVPVVGSQSSANALRGLLKKPHSNPSKD